MVIIWKYYLFKLIQIKNIYIILSQIRVIGLDTIVKDRYDHAFAWIAFSPRWNDIHVESFLTTAVLYNKYIQQRKLLSNCPWKKKMSYNCNKKKEKGVVYYQVPLIPIERIGELSASPQGEQTSSCDGSRDRARSWRLEIISFNSLTLMLLFYPGYLYLKSR